MNRASQIILGTMLLLAGITVGGFAGFKYGTGWKLYLELIEQKHYEAFAAIQKQAGTLESREEALKQFIALTEKRSSTISPLFTEKTYAVDMALSYARLSILAEQRGNSEKAQEYITQAVSYCPKIGWKECTPEIIYGFAVKADSIGKNSEQK